MRATKALVFVLTVFMVLAMLALSARAATEYEAGSAGALVPFFAACPAV